MKYGIERSLPIVAAVVLTACGGSSSDDEKSVDDLANVGFTQSAEWTFTEPESGEKTECFDFDANQVVPCENSTAWDMKIVHGTGGRSTPSFYTNSGVSGNGNGAALGSPFDYRWEQLTAFRSGTVDGSGDTLPTQAFSVDTAANAFSDSVFVYADRRMTPTHQVFVVTTDKAQLLPDISTANTAFAVQAVNYYGGDTGATSGHVSIRWVDVTAAQAEPRTLEINATSYTDWTHVDLVHGTVVDAPTDDNWHLAFQRYVVKTNSGISGHGSVGSFKGSAVAEDADDAAKLAALHDDSTHWGWASTGWSRSSWRVDTAFSTLNPAYKTETDFTPKAGVARPMQFNFGFYRYHSGVDGHLDHSLSAATENGVLLRSGEGNSHARVRLTEIRYADDTDYNSQRTYTFAFEVEPAR